MTALKTTVTGTPTHLHFNAQRVADKQFLGEIDCASGATGIRTLTGCEAFFSFWGAVKVRIGDRTLFLKKTSLQNYLIRNLTGKTPDKRSARICSAAQKALRAVAKRQEGDYHANMGKILMVFAARASAGPILDNTPTSQSEWEAIFDTEFKSEGTRSRSNTPPLARAATPTVQDRLSSFFTEHYSEGDAIKFARNVAPFKDSVKRTFLHQLETLHQAKDLIQSEKEKGERELVELQTRVAEAQSNSDNAEQALKEAKAPIIAQIDEKRAKDPLVVAAKAEFQRLLDEAEAKDQRLIPLSNQAQQCRDRIEAIDEEIAQLKKAHETTVQEAQNLFETSTYKNFIEKGAAWAALKAKQAKASADLSTKQAALVTEKTAKQVELGIASERLARISKEKIDLSSKREAQRLIINEADQTFQRELEQLLEVSDEVQTAEANFVSKQGVVHQLREELHALPSKLMKRRLGEIIKLFRGRPEFGIQIHHLTPDRLETFEKNVVKVLSYNETFLRFTPKRGDTISLKGVASRLYTDSTFGTDISSSTRNKLLFAPIRTVIRVGSSDYGNEHPEVRVVQKAYEEYLETPSRPATPELESM